MRETIGKIACVILGIIFLLIVLTLLLSTSTTEIGQKLQEVANASEQKEEEPVFPGEMEMVGQHNGFLYYRDDVTDILYIVHGRKGSSPFVMMVNPATGLPMTYSQYLQISENNDG